MGGAWSALRGMRPTYPPRGIVARSATEPNVIKYGVEPEEAWKVLNRWRTLCPSRFDIEAEKAGVRYSFTSIEALSWSDQSRPRKPHKRRRKAYSERQAAVCAFVRT